MSDESESTAHQTADAADPVRAARPHPIGADHWTIAAVYPRRTGWPPAPSTGECTRAGRGLVHHTGKPLAERYRPCLTGRSVSCTQPAVGLPAAAPTEDDDAAQEWYWTLYNQSLNPVLRALVGEIYPLGLPQQESGQKEQDSTKQNHNAAWLSVSWNGITVRSRMQAADAVWLALFSRADWHHQRRALPAGMTIAIPLTLAEAVLPLSALRRLRTGDLILPNRPWFTPSGEGTLSSGTLRLHGTLQLSALAPYTFTVTDMETVSMPATDTMLAAPHSDASALEYTPTSDNVTENLPPLPVTLHIRCGSLTMTLAKLQHLASGSVLTLRDVVPGQAWLYHGDIALASGDLVDVEGRLGLQITQCFSAPAHELPIADEEYAAEPELAP